MPAPIYECATEGAVSLAANTAKTILGVKTTSAAGLMLVGFRIGFDGTSGTPVLVELTHSTWATNVTLTTNYTGTTPRQRFGRVMSAGANLTSGKNWSSEPTVQTVIDEFLLTPNGGLVVYDFPLGTEPDADLNNGFMLRCTAPAIVNVRGGLLVARC